MVHAITVWYVNPCWTGGTSNTQEREYFENVTQSDVCPSIVAGFSNRSVILSRKRWNRGSAAWRILKARRNCSSVPMGFLILMLCRRMPDDQWLGSPSCIKLYQERKSNVSLWTVNMVVLSTNERFQAPN